MKNIGKIFSLVRKNSKIKKILLTYGGASKGAVRFEARYILSAQRFTYLALKFEIFQIHGAHLAKVWRFEYANGGNVAACCTIRQGTRYERMNRAFTEVE